MKTDSFLSDFSDLTDNVKHDFTHAVNSRIISTDSASILERRIKRMRKNVYHVGKSIEPGRGERAWMITLTYAKVDTWEPHHISDCIRRLRYWLKKRKLIPKYCWVAELQKRGAVHYHLIVVLPLGIRPPKFDIPDGKIGKMWSHGMTNRKAVRKSAFGYLMKYASKGIENDKKMPRGLRLYGCGGLSKNDKEVRKWKNFPTWLKNTAAVNEISIKNGKRVNRETGEIYQSPYKITIIDRELFLSQVSDLPKIWVDGPWSRVDYGYEPPPF